MASEAPKIRIGFCGEVRSGKSTALQSILRKVVIPDFFGVENRPMVRVTLGSAHETIEIRTSGGGTRAVATVDEIEPSDDIEEIAISLTGDYGLGACELVELPPFRDGHVEFDQVAIAAGCAVVVWTTIGSQAWRLSEKNIIEEIRPQLSASTVLVATRADKFRCDADREKLESRLERESSEYFEAGLLLGVPPRLFEAPEDDAAWSASGADELVTSLRDAMAMASDAMPRPTEASPLADESDATVEHSARPVSATVDTDPKEPAGRTLTQVASVFDDIRSSSAHPLETEVDADATSQDQADEQPEDLPEPPRDPIAECIANFKGIVAVGAVDLGDDKPVERIFGETADVEKFATFCARSADPALAGFAEMETNDDCEQIVMQNNTVIFHVRKKRILVLAVESEAMSPGIARTAFSRIAKLYDTQSEAHTAAA